MANDYSRILRSFWTSRTADTIREKGTVADFLIALYLVSCPHCNMIGLYRIDPSVIRVDLYGRRKRKKTHEEVEAGILRSLAFLQNECDFLRYDEKTGFCWIIKMAFWQIVPASGVLDPTDKRVIGVSRILDKLKSSPFAREFAEFYCEILYLQPNKYARQSGSGSPFEAPSKPLRSQVTYNRDSKGNGVPDTGGVAGGAGGERKPLRSPLGTQFDDEELGKAGL